MGLAHDKKTWISEFLSHIKHAQRENTQHEKLRNPRIYWKITSLYSGSTWLARYDLYEMPINHGYEVVGSYIHPSKTRDMRCPYNGHDTAGSYIPTSKTCDIKNIMRTRQLECPFRAEEGSIPLNFRSSLLTVTRATMFVYVTVQTSSTNLNQPLTIHPATKLTSMVFCNAWQPEHRWIVNTYEYSLTNQYLWLGKSAFYKCGMQLPEIKCQ